MTTINRVNLAISKASTRIRETAMRKLMGGKNLQLFSRVLIESLTISSPVIPLFIISSRKISFLIKALSGRTVYISPSGWFLNFAIIYWFIITTVVSISIYLYLPKFHKAGAINLFSNHKSSWKLKKSMIFIQLALSTGVIVSTLHITRQVEFMNGKDLGFIKKNLIYILLPSEGVKKRADTLQKEIRKLPEVQQTSLSSRFLGNAFSGWYIKTPSSEKVEVTSLFVDYDFLETFGMKILKGRSFSRAFPTDPKEGFIINSRAAKALKLPNPIGKKIEFPNRKKGKIIGLIEDINFQPLKQKTSPLVITFNMGSFHKNFIAVRVKPGKMAEFRRKVEKLWKSFEKSQIAIYYQDRLLQTLYTSELELQKSMFYTSLITVLIASTGLIGVASLIIQLRTRELGIRKILGATTFNLLSMVVKEFNFIVVFSTLAISPATYIFIDKWLSVYPFRVSQSLLIYTSTTALMLMLTVAAVSLTSWRTSAKNPSETLRDE